MFKAINGRASLIDGSAKDTFGAALKIGIEEDNGEGGLALSRSAMKLLD